jgi:hypothetical protein
MLRLRTGPTTGRPTWPGSHRFAFSIFDDTDLMTLDDGPVIYALLDQLGMRITKSVWPLPAPAARTTGGSTCADPDYLAWVLELRALGHEIGYHNATDGSSTREQTRAGLDRFRELFGHDPKVGADHAGNREALYCATKRLSGWRSAAYGGAQRIVQPRRPRFSGEVPTSPYFWGDLCRERVTYWRGLTFDEPNLLRVCPVVPYHDPARPFVNYWFPSSDAPWCADLIELLDDARMARLEADGGVCIVYTHLGLDAVVDGRVQPELARRLADLSRRNGWFAPVGDILDHLRQQQGSPLISDRQRTRYEMRWVVDRLRTRARLGPSVATTSDGS